MDDYGTRFVKTSLLSEIEILTGKDATERMEMALEQPITSREQSPERTLQESKLQNNVIIAPYDRAARNSNRASDNYTLYLFTCQACNPE